MHIDICILMYMHDNTLLVIMLTVKTLLTQSEFDDI